MVTMSPDMNNSFNHVPAVWDVGALLAATAQTLEQRFATLTVRGELGSFTRAASGHCYFMLKSPDGQAALRCAMFRRAASLLDFAPRDGQAVELRGRLTIYEPRGELQMVVEAMRRSGEGTLMEQFLRLKARLEGEGLFDAARKRPVALYPRRIGVVTSLAAAALQDVLSALARRAPHVEVLIHPSMVQGAQAPAELVRAIRRASIATAPAERIDTLIVCRGGGSIEDLWAFNDEQVVRAIAASPVPVISGVGHDTDFTLADFAADLRAPTPTAAAELAAVPRAEALERLERIERHWQARLQQRLEREQQRLDRAELRLARPADLLAREGQRLDHLAQRLQRVLPERLQRESQRLDQCGQRLPAVWRHQHQRHAQRLALAEARLQALDPQRVLSRGYALLTDPDGRACTSVAGAQKGDTLTATLADGRMSVQVVQVMPDLAPGREA